MIADASGFGPLIELFLLGLALGLATREDAVGDHQQGVRDSNYSAILAPAAGQAMVFDPELVRRHVPAGSENS